MKNEPTDTTATGPETRREIIEWLLWYKANATADDWRHLYRQTMRVANGLPVERESSC